MNNDVLSILLLQSQHLMLWQSKVQKESKASIIPKEKKTFLFQSFRELSTSTLHLAEKFFFINGQFFFSNLKLIYPSYLRLYL